MKRGVCCRICRGAGERRSCCVCNCRCIAFQNEGARCLPLRASKDADLVNAWQPFFHRLLPYSIAHTRFRFFPYLRFKVLQLAITIPDRCPLHTGLHVRVVKEDIHLFDGIAKTGCRCAGAAVINLRGELNSLDLKSGFRGDIPRKQRFDHQRDSWWGGDCDCC